MSLTKLYHRMPPSMRLIAWRLYYLPIDLIDRLSGDRDELTPPKGMIYIGRGGKKVGQKLL